jgi:hypothetical protein
MLYTLSRAWPRGSRLQEALPPVDGPSGEGRWPPVTIVEAESWLLSSFDVPADSVQISRYHREDFLIVFAFYDNMLKGIHEKTSVSVSFVLIFKS